MMASEEKGLTVTVAVLLGWFLIWLVMPASRLWMMGIALVFAAATLLGFAVMLYHAFYRR